MQQEYGFMKLGERQSTYIEFKSLWVESDYDVMLN